MSTVQQYTVGQYVQITNRNLKGHIAYIGETNFAAGQWIGLVLDVEKGRNNGTVRGTKYFKCGRNYGLFVRATQLSSVGGNMASGAANKTAKQMEEPPPVPASPAPQQQEARQIKTIEKEKIVEEEKVKDVVTNPGAVSKAMAAAQPKSDTKSRKLSIDSSSSSGSGSHLRTTKINQPLPVRQQFSISRSHLSLRPSVHQETLTLTLPIAQKVPSTNAAVAPPKRSKTTVSPSETFCCAAKRASFVETGFLEILHPQFTPGQRLHSPTLTSSQAGANNAQTAAADRCKELEMRIEDLNDEVATLRQQRADDKLKLHDCEKLKIHNEQLTEFKAKIMEQHGGLQRDLQRCRQEARDHSDTMAKCKREIDDMADSMEFLTLDKEMAEERVETLLLELEVAQERIEELTLDVEILRAENESQVAAAGEQQQSPTTNHGKEESALPTLGEWRKMEQYNGRLRETVVRLRDMLTEEKHGQQKASKELETKQSEITELHKIKQLLSQRVDVLEMHILDLKEQVDAALGAEAMVASLADGKLELEDRLKMLEEEVAELEALEEIHEQLIESNQELEIDLREEIDMLNASHKTLQLEKDQALETIYDRDITIQKFRELVKALTEQLHVRDTATATATSLSEDLSSAANLSNADELQNAATTTIDFNQMFSVTKAYGRAIDGQLSGVEVKLLRLHVEYLLAFVPEDFLLRGGEHDVILVMILLRRLVEKLDIICQAIKEKFPASCEFAKDAIFEGFSVHRFAFRSKCMFHLRSLKLIAQQFVYAFDHSDFELCSHLAIYRAEMESQERHLDEMLALLKNGMLDENSRTDGIEAAATFFMSLHLTLMPPKELSELINEHELYVTLLEVLESALHCIHTQASLLHTIIRLGDEDTESFHSMQYLMDQTNAFKQILKKLHHKLSSTTGGAGDVTARSSSAQLCHGLPHERMLQIQTTIDCVGRLINILTATAKEATKDIYTSRGDSDNSDDCNDMGIGHDKLWQILAIQCEKLGPADRGMPAALLKRCAQLLNDQIGEFFKFIHQRENEQSTNVNTVFVRSSSRTLMQRAAQVKRHFEDVKQLQQCIGERDKEIKTLKYVAKMKQNDFSEMQIRKEMAERNLNRIVHDQDQAIQTIATYIDNVENEIRCKDVAFAHALADLAGKLGQLEATVQRLGENLSSNSQTLHIEESMTSREISALKQWLRRRTEECERLRAGEMRSKLKRLAPIHVPRRPDARLQQLDGDLKRVHNEWVVSQLMTGRPHEAGAAATAAAAAIKVRAHRVTEQIFDTYFERQPHRACNTDFAKFPTSDVREMFRRTHTPPPPEGALEMNQFQIFRN